MCDLFSDVALQNAHRMVRDTNTLNGGLYTVGAL